MLCVECLAVVTVQGGNKADLKQSLMHQLVCMMQAASVSGSYTETAHTFIVKVGHLFFLQLIDSLVWWTFVCVCA